MRALPREAVIDHRHLIGSTLPFPNQPSSRFQLGTSAPPDLTGLVELLCNLAELTLPLRAEAAESHFLHPVCDSSYQQLAVRDNLEWEIVAPQRLGIYAIWHDAYGFGLPANSRSAPTASSVGYRNCWFNRSQYASRAAALLWFIAGPPPVRRLALASVTIRQPPLRRSVANTPLTCIERTPSRMALLSVVRRTGIHPHVAVEANSIAAIMEMVRVAGLATILPEMVSQEQTGLRVVPLTPAIDSRRVALLQRRDGYRSAASRAFVAVAQDHARAMEDRDQTRAHPTSTGLRSGL